MSHRKKRKATQESGPKKSRRLEQPPDLKSQEVEPLDSNATSKLRDGNTEVNQQCEATVPSGGNQSKVQT